MKKIIAAAKADLGVLTEAQEKAGREFATSLDRLQTSLQGLSDKFGATFAPLGKNVSDNMHDAVIAIRDSGFIEELGTIGTDVGNLMREFKDLAPVLKFGFDALKMQLDAVDIVLKGIVKAIDYLKDWHAPDWLRIPNSGMPNLQNQNYVPGGGGFGGAEIIRAALTGGGGGGGGGSGGGVPDRGQTPGGGPAAVREAITGSGADSLTKLIDESAGDPKIARIMEGIRAGESGHGPGYDVNHGTAEHPEDSYGPFQLNRRGGLGAEFEKENPGLSLKDPSTIPAQAKWVAGYLKKQYAKNPNFNPKTVFHGYKGETNANPAWGDAGYQRDGAAAGLTGPQTSIVKTAAEKLGESAGGNKADLMEYLRTGGHGMDPTKTAWCAAFVGASLEHAGYASLKSNVANDYRGYGTPGKGEAGDVAIVDEGHGRQGVGGHVGFATGLRDKYGRYQILAGNTGGVHGDRHVGLSWYDPSRLEFRHPVPRENIHRTAREAVGPMKHSVEGNANINLALSGFPKGTHATSSADGLFKQIKVDRGVAAPWASQGD